MKYEPIAKHYYDGLDEGKFLGLKCPKCGHIEFPPYPACNNCGHIGGEWVDLTDADVEIREIYSISPMMTIGDFMPYAPIFSCEAFIEEGGIEIACLIFGVTKKNYKELREQVPLHGKLVVMPMDGYNSMAVSINDAVPTQKGKKGVMDQGKMIAMMGKDKKAAVEEQLAKKNAHPLDGRYNCTMQVMGQKRACAITLSIDENTVAGILEAMDSEMPFEDGSFEDGKLSFTLEARGSEFAFDGTAADGKIQGTLKVGTLTMQVEGEKG